MDAIENFGKVVRVAIVKIEKTNTWERQRQRQTKTRTVKFSNRLQRHLVSGIVTYSNSVYL